MRDWPPCLTLQHREQNHIPHPLVTAIAQGNNHPHFIEIGVNSSQPPHPLFL